ncbi:MAG: undecaprenyldiphospho-muramoylpentapeptide beta-N-acetylglucosaminyltransferase [Coriobacteriales bacterium]|jgi:UDP-N-acetylglucosamine--N-acetylmuramyl-(pentapeptide) pyrophosphoryl-undecaprenol N-acetylglucosamine transferase|nr:undecaprenyldiphospho-muramoylpentapeptide beta-N-acetylglucosaminyltransferase [Coriobacteriales bacterium]
MKIVITGGGTAGHINPALAVAQELRSLGHELHYAGTPRGLEARLVPQEGFPYVAFEAAGFDRKKPLSLITSSAKIAVSAMRARRWLATLSPDVVVGFGGYVSIPVGLAASRLKIPLAIHEQNSTGGMANRFLARRAQLLALAYEAAAKDFKTEATVEVVGNPVRASLFEADRARSRASFGLSQDATVLLAFGGSLGARHLNEALLAQAERLLAQAESQSTPQVEPQAASQPSPNLQVLHITGTRDFDEATATLKRMPQVAPHWHLIDYCDRMGEAYAAADAVCSRAGATTLAEIGTLGLPSLLVPYPYAAADEQTANARSLVDAGAAAMLADSELDSPLFIERLTRLVSDADYRADMRSAAASLGKAQARQTLARLIIALPKTLQ